MSYAITTRRRSDTCPLVCRHIHPQHGSVPRPAPEFQSATERLDAILQPAQSGALRAAGVESATVVLHLDDEPSAIVRKADVDPVRLRVLQNVRQRFRYEEIGGALQVRRES